METLLCFQALEPSAASVSYYDIRNSTSVTPCRQQLGFFSRLVVRTGACLSPLPPPGTTQRQKHRSPLFSYLQTYPVSSTLSPLSSPRKPLSLIMSSLNLFNLQDKDSLFISMKETLTLTHYAFFQISLGSFEKSKLMNLTAL